MASVAGIGPSPRLRKITTSSSPAINRTPGPMPAINNWPTESDVTSATKTIGTLGGITGPRTADAATVAAENSRRYPALRIIGNIAEPIIEAAAGADPLTEDANALAPITVWARPPLIQIGRASRS